MTNANDQNMAEYFGWTFHPFSDAWRIDTPFYSQRDQRIAQQGVQLLQHGKSFALTGPSGAGKSTLAQHLLASLDANYYHCLHIHYGGLQRNALIKAGSASGQTAKAHCHALKWETLCPSGDPGR